MLRKALPQANGSFADLDSLVEHLGGGASIALAIGKGMPKRRSNVLTPAQINRLLLDPRKGDGHPAANSPSPNVSHGEDC